MRRQKVSGVVAVLGIAVALAAAGCSKRSRRADGDPGPVSIAAGVPLPVSAKIGDVLSFPVTAFAPPGVPVTLRLVNPPPGGIFAPVAGGGPAITGRLRWPVLAESGGMQTLLFRSDLGGLFPKTAFLRIPVRVSGPGNRSAMVVADVTGDGILDVIGGAKLADVGGTADVGAVYVWRGGSSVSGTPTATLSRSGAAAGDRLGDGPGRAIQAADVTGDGVADVIVAAPSSDPGGTQDAGSVTIWAGGPGLTGGAAAAATLVIPSGMAWDLLGVGSGQPVQVADVTGDGTDDLVVAAIWANSGPVQDTGRILVWAGGSGLTGTPSPSATLAVAGASWADQLGLGSGQGVVLADVTGDGTLDIVASAATADIAGVIDSGAVYVWAGGAALTGNPSPLATLAATGAAPSDFLGYASGHGVQCGDVTGDGVLDVVAAAVWADVAGVTDAGAVHVWAGGGLTGTPPPTATLINFAASPQDYLGWVTGNGVLLADVSGDGTLDVVVGAEFADSPPLSDTGAIRVWIGGPALTGTMPPTATLAATGAVAGDFLGFGRGEVIQVAELTGDGILDVVATAVLADVGGLTDAGATYVWAGGGSLGGSVAATATLAVTGGASNDFHGWSSGQGVQLADVTGDGAPDVLVGAQFADVGVAADAGAVRVWAGGAALSGSPNPTATLAAPSPAPGDFLTYGAGQGFQVADVSGDGIADVAAAAPLSDPAGTQDAGRCLVWRGSAGLSGTVSANANLSVPGALFGDQLGVASGTGILAADVTGDGVLDLVVAATSADSTLVGDIGMVYVWAGGTGLSGSATLRASLGSTAPSFRGYLATGAGQGVLCADVTGDGVPDVLAAAAAEDVSGTTDAGALYLWPGGGGLTGSAAATPLRVTGASAGDRLGD
ncbi:MAG: VCBS repeat-containing protein [Planctomycetales bacterium]|nr:VCBS repeat-containing protein [Planctomycetales bacterium]